LTFEAKGNESLAECVCACEEVGNVIAKTRTTKIK